MAQKTTTTYPGEDLAVPRTTITRRKAELLLALLHEGASWLGCTEPTLCHQASKRLHEEDPTGQAVMKSKSPEDLGLHQAEYARSQHELGLTAANQQVHLPRLVQYDLYHLLDALPENRTNAAADSVHSFFYRTDAQRELLRHLEFYQQNNVVPCLLWHVSNPLWGTASFDAIRPNNPFALKGEADELVLLQFVADHIHWPRADWPTEWTDQQVAVLGTMQDKLDRLADFAHQLADRGIVALFRPYHEANGHWFWWSNVHFATENPDDPTYTSVLWHHTRQYLENVKGVDNLLYTWSPNIMGSWLTADDEELATAYSHGVHVNEVDVLGVDCYASNLVNAVPAGPDFREQALGEALTVLAKLRTLFPGHPVGFTELGASYHKLLPGDDSAAAFASADRGAATFSQALRRRFADPNLLPPHFTIFWRNEPGLLEFPVTGCSPEMDAVVADFYPYFATREVDLRASGLVL